MTEEEWLGCRGAIAMLRFLSEKASERKLRLFACACCYRIWPHLKDKRSRTAVEVCEKYADGSATILRLHAVHQTSGDAFAEAQWAARSDEETTPAKAAIRLGSGNDFSAEWTADWAAATCGVAARENEYSLRKLASDEVWEQYNSTYLAAEAEEARTQTSLIRDVFGNPFRPVIFSSEWRHRTPQLPWRGRCTRRVSFPRCRFWPMHFKTPGATTPTFFRTAASRRMHVRGCWVVDLVLGKQ